MKSYKLNSENKFFTQNVFTFKNFDIATGNSIIQKLEKNVELLENLTELDKHTSINVQTKFWNHPKIKHVSQQTQKVVNLKVTASHHKHQGESELYSLVSKPDFEYRLDINSHLTSEHYIRNFSNTSTFLYLNIPATFIQKHLSRIICETDYQKYVKALQEYNSNDPHELIKIYNKYDSIYNDLVLIHDGSKRHTWRRDMFLYMAYSIKKYGYLNPIVSVTWSNVFFYGSHRTGVGPAVGRDVPVLILVEPQNVVDEKIWFTTASYFRNNEPVLFCADYIEKKLKGYWLKKDDFIEFWVPATNKEGKNPDNVSVFNPKKSYIDLIQLYQNKKPDFLFNE